MFRKLCWSTSFYLWVGAVLLGQEIERSETCCNTNYEQENQAFVQFHKLTCLEKWQDADLQLGEMMSATNAAIGNRNLLFAQAIIAEQKQQWSMVDSLYSLLLSDSNASKQQWIAYGLYCFKHDRFDLAEEVLVEFPDLLNGAKAMELHLRMSFYYQSQLSQNKSDQAIKKAERIRNRITPPDPVANALYYNDMAIHASINGDLKVADSLLNLADHWNITCPIPSNSGYIASTRSSILYALGDIESAASNVERAIQHFTDAENQVELARAYYKLGQYNFDLGFVDTARSIITEALDLIDHHYNHRPNIQKSQMLNTLAGIAEYNYEDALADSLYRISIVMAQATLGPQSLEYANTLSNYAQFLEVTQDYEQALEYYKAIADIDTSIFSTTHSSYLTTLYNLARCYGQMDSFQLADHFYNQANTLQLLLLDHYFQDFDEQTRLSYRLEAMGNFDVFFTYAVENPSPYNQTQMQDIVLATKNLVLDFSKKYYQARTDNSIYNRWLEAKRSFSLATKAHPGSYDSKGDSLLVQIQHLEKQLVQSQNWKDEIYKFSDLQGQLQSKEASIDFFNYYITDVFGRLNDSIVLGALITTTSSVHPQLVVLGDQKKVENLLNRSSDPINNGAINKALFRFIWEPLLPYLDGIDKIHLSAEGSLYKLAFDGLAIIDDVENRFLADVYELHYYSNLRDFISSRPENQIRSAVILGNPTYGQYSDDSDYFQPLFHTKDEAISISQVFNSANIDNTLFMGDEATETALYTAMHEGASIMHLATHAFAFPWDSTMDNATTRRELVRSNPNGLFRSGLALANINKTWASAPLDETEDGLITAAEISTHQFAGNPIVVLSACQTGLGRIADGEGIFGLQRAFRLAGASDLVLSLWPVSDEATALLMQWFYTFLTQGKSTTVAMRLARQKLRIQFPAPSDWASFVVYE